jgi:predicted phosphohydrolase
MARTDTLTVAWATDIHFDHAEAPAVDDFHARLAASGAELLLLGGDISVAEDVVRDVARMADLTGLEVAFVLGNHDYYGGSVADVQRRMAKLAHPRAKWLPHAGPRELLPGVILVGAGGWGDARFGNIATSDGVLNDYLMINELALVFDFESFAGPYGPDTALEAELNRLGRAEADMLAPHLEAAAKNADHVVVLTHVPAFREACIHQGKATEENWLHGFACGALGEVLRAAAAARPKCLFTVLSGHTHGEGVVAIADNLVAHTQSARYEHPDFRLVTIGRESLTVEPA